MASDFDNLFADAGTEITSTFGGTAVYTTAAGVEIDLADAVFSEHAPDTGPDRDGTRRRRTAAANVAVADVAEPARGDSFAIDGVEWSVDDFRPIDGGVRWSLALVRTETVERSTEGYRIPR